MKTINSKTIKVKKGKTKMVAHRGLSGLERENSINAFVASCNRSYFGSECDIHYTKDKKLVVCHDNFTSRVSNYDIIIPESDFSDLELVRLKAFGKDEDGRELIIPTFEEYLEIHKKYNKKCIVEIKCKITLDEAKEILEIIKPYYKLIIFISFDLNNLLLIRSLDKKIPIQYLSSKYDDSLLDVCENNNFGIDIHFAHLTKEITDKFHERKIVVNAWTVNDKEIAEELISWGIDYITTNILE